MGRDHRNEWEPGADLSDVHPKWLTFTQNGGGVSGSVATGTNTKAVAIDNADLRNDALSFEAHDNANRLRKFRLTLNGGVLGGEATVGVQV